MKALTYNEKAVKGRTVYCDYGVMHMGFYVDTFETPEEAQAYCDKKNKDSWKATYFVA